MAAAAPGEVKKIGVGELRALISDAAELRKGTQLFDENKLSNLARHQNKLFCDAKGSGSSVYKVTLAYKESPSGFEPRCSCPSKSFNRDRHNPFCKHAAALLVAWARAPESFVVADGAPGGAREDKRPVKKGAASPATLMKSGVDQVSTLVRELGISGIAAMGGDRVDQVQQLAEGLRENKLRRLSARALDLSKILKSAAGTGAALPAVTYTNLMADLLLTARKLEKHLAGEPLDDRHVEELVGKTWTKNDRKPIAGLDLVEYAFSTRTTADDFVIRESRFFDVASGKHYSEKQIVPAFLRRQDPKPSRGGSLLGGARGTTFPGYPPFRIDFTDLGDKRPVVSEVLAAIVEKALPDVGSALAALQEHRKDVFAPDLLPVAIRVDTLFARAARLQAVDEKGHALHLPEHAGLEERLAGSLREARLRALIGDVGIDAALPTLWPVAAIIEGPRGFEMRGVVEPGAAVQHGPLEGSAWGAAAREAGASGAAIVLGEVREELADAFSTGLAGLTQRVTDPLAARLRELGLEKQAALLQSIPQKPDPADRIDDFIKLYQVLEIALVRLAGATQVDRATMDRVPTFESVCVPRPDDALHPDEVSKRRASGAMNRYLAAVHYARHYESLPPEEIAANVFPIWADGAAAPYVVKAFATRKTEALRAAQKALGTKAGRVAKMTAVRVLRAVGGREAESMLDAVVRDSHDTGLTAMARDALDALDAVKPGGDTVRLRQQRDQIKMQGFANQLLTAPRGEERGAALRELVDLGNLGAIPAIRQAFFNDASREVRDSAAYALAQLGDTEMVDTFLRMLGSRAEDERDAKVAAYALGNLGDVRGLNELLAAYAEGYKPAIIAEAIRSFGSVALEPLVDLIEARPEIGKRTAALHALEKLNEHDLASCLVRRLEARRGQPDMPEKALLYLKLADAREITRREVARAVLVMLGQAEGKEEKAAVKAAHKALGVVKRGA